MKFFSMFSGIGGFELGIYRAYSSWERSRMGDEKRFPSTDDSGSRGRPQQASCIGYSEVNKYANQIYSKHFPDHRNYGDATEIIAEELPDFDLLCGGFPCQAFSVAGKRLGFDDPRGNLFFEIARIAKVKRPRYLLLENVKGLLSHDNGNTFEAILSTLSELGYGVEWQLLNSKDFGVPQNRERVFIVGHLGGFTGSKVFPLGYGGREVQEEGFSGLNQVGNIDEKGHNSLWGRVYDPSGVSTTINSGGGGGVGAKTGLYISKTIRGGGGSPPGSRQNWDSIVDGARIRRLTPTECERLQGFPDGWTEGLSDSQRYKCLGNAVTVNVVEAVARVLLKGEINE